MAASPVGTMGREKSRPLVQFSLIVGCVNQKKILENFWVSDALSQFDCRLNRSVQVEIKAEKATALVWEDWKQNVSKHTNSSCACNWLTSIKFPTVARSIAPVQSTEWQNMLQYTIVSTVKAILIHIKTTNLLSVTHKSWIMQNNEQITVMNCYIYSHIYCSYTHALFRNGQPFHK